MKIWRFPQAFTTRGFTIVEMMIAIAIMAIITALALPGLGAFFARNDLAGATNEIISGINQARSEAVARSNTVAICPTNDGAGCDNGDWESGWIVFVDENVNGNLNVGEDIIAVSNSGVVAGVTIDGFNAGLSFGPTGLLAAAIGGNILISHSELTMGRQLAISNLGQVTLSEVDTS